MIEIHFYMIKLLRPNPRQENQLLKKKSNFPKLNPSPN